MPDSHRIHPGTIVGGRRVLAAAATAAAEMGIVVTEYNPGMSGEGGSAVSTPERTQSPPVVVSFTRTEKATVGGTALEENVEVRGAQLENGLLHVDLERIVPEEKKPRRIVINGKSEGRVIDAKVRAA